MNIRNSSDIDKLNEKAWDDSLFDPGTTIDHAKDTLAAAEGLGYAKGQADSWLIIGWCHYYLSRLSDAFAAFIKAQPLFEEAGDIVGTCKLLNALGVYNHEISRLDKAIEYYTASLETARTHGLKSRELIAMSNIGELCLELGNPKEALDYLIPAYECMASDEGPENKADTLRNIGKAFFDMENLSMALEFTQKAYDVASSAGQNLLSAECNESLASITLAMGDLDAAESRIREGLANASRPCNKRQRASLLLVNAAFLKAKGKYAESLKSLDEAIILCSEVQAKSTLFKAYELISDVHESMGDHKQALEYFKRFSAYRAEVQNEDTAHKVRSIQIQAEVEKAQQQAEIYRLRNIDLKEKTEELEEINSQITSISQIGRRITASLDYATVVETVYESLKPLLEMDFFGIALPDADEIVYKRFYEDGERNKERRIALSADNSFTTWTFINRRPVLIADKAKEYTRYLQRPPKVSGRPAQSIVSLPLSIEDRIIGVLMVQNCRTEAYSPRDLKLLEALAPYIAIAVENAIIHDRLEDLNHALSDEKRRLERATLKISHLANHDTLTGLPNRRLLFELMGKALETARRAGGKIGVAFIDLDDFKPINDRFGHAAGDSALVAMSERIRGIIRASDIVARVGGDEFITVMTNVKGREDIERVAVKILSECAKPLSFSGNVASLGLSMGIAVFPDDGDSIEELINRADTAMYTVKHGDKHAFTFSRQEPSA